MKSQYTLGAVKLFFALGRVMSHRPSRKHDALWIMLAQLGFIVIASLFVWGVYGGKEAGSFLMGCLVCALPNGYLYWRVFAHAGARAANKIVRAFYFGELVKFILTAIGFMIVLVVPWRLPLWIFLGFISAQVGLWAASIIFGYLPMKKRHLNSINLGNKTR